MTEFKPFYGKHLKLWNERCKHCLGCTGMEMERWIPPDKCGRFMDGREPELVQGRIEDGKTYIV